MAKKANGIDNSKLLIIMLKSKILKIKLPIIFNLAAPAAFTAVEN